MRALFAILTALMLIAATPMAAERLIDAINAQAVGDSEKAFRIFESLAKQGDAAAQGMLGIMYAEGQGVAWNYVNGYAWLSIAAAQSGELDDLSLDEIVRKVVIDMAEAETGSYRPTLLCKSEREVRDGGKKKQSNGKKDWPQFVRGQIV